jgi:hypothetical protein
MEMALDSAKAEKQNTAEKSAATKHLIVALHLLEIMELVSLPRWQLDCVENVRCIWLSVNAHFIA